VTAPGWYPDPSGAPNQRYFDGNQWTEQQAPVVKKKRRVWPWVLLSLFVIAALVVGGGYAWIKYSTGNDADLTAAAAGTAVRDGKFEFVVNSVDVAEDWTADPRPQGEYLVADITVTNFGDTQGMFDPETQKLIDTQGHEYAGSYNAAQALRTDSPQVNIDPGASATIALPFDVPPGTTPEKMILRQTMLTRGVAVKVS